VYEGQSTQESSVLIYEEVQGAIGIRSVEGPAGVVSTTGKLLVSGPDIIVSSCAGGKLSTEGPYGTLGSDGGPVGAEGAAGAAGAEGTVDVSVVESESESEVTRLASVEGPVGVVSTTGKLSVLGPAGVVSTTGKLLVSGPAGVVSTTGKLLVSGPD
jgi:hypothetical protein